MKKFVLPWILVGLKILSFLALSPKPGIHKILATI